MIFEVLIPRDDTSSANRKMQGSAHVSDPRGVVCGCRMPSILRLLTARKSVIAGNKQPDSGKRDGHYDLR